MQHGFRNHIHELFSYFIILKSIDPSCTLNRSFPIHDFVTSCIGHLENIGLLNYTEFPILKKTSHLLISNITSDLIRKSSSIESLLSPQEQTKVFWSFNFHSEVWIIFLATNTVYCFPQSDRLILSFSESCLPDT